MRALVRDTSRTTASDSLRVSCRRTNVDRGWPSPPTSGCPPERSAVGIPGAASTRRRSAPVIEPTRRAPATRSRSQGVRDASYLLLQAYYLKPFEHTDGPRGTRVLRCDDPERALIREKGLAIDGVGYDDLASGERRIELGQREHHLIP